MGRLLQIPYRVARFILQIPYFIFRGHPEKELHEQESDGNGDKVSIEIVSFPRRAIDQAFCLLMEFCSCSILLTASLTMNDTVHPG